MKKSDFEDSWESNRKVDKVGQQMVITEMQFGLMPRCETTNAIFILRQLQEKYLAKKEEFVLYIFRFGECFWSSA